MSVSLYYDAYRTTPLTELEAAEVERVVAARQATFPYEDEEHLCLYENDDGRPERVLAGSTKMPLDPERLMPVLSHLLDSMTELRRAVPDARWRVHLDDLDIPWVEDEGYVLTGL
jgi:hypothetical protein